MTRSGLSLIRGAAPAILPSILSCDFGDLCGEVARLEAAGTRLLHLDVMDGHFVPNLTFGMPIVEGLRRHTQMPLDVHLMISDPLAYAKPMVDSGADCLTFHVEAVEDAVDVAGRIRDLGVGVGMAINPDTSFEKLDAALDSVDLVLVMSVNAGFGGQKFNPVAIDRVASLRSRKPDLLIEIDGGINESTIGAAYAAGCDLFVVGTALIGQADYTLAMDGLMDAMTAGSDAKGTR